MRKFLQEAVRVAIIIGVFCMAINMLANVIEGYEGRKYVAPEIKGAARWSYYSNEPIYTDGKGWSSHLTILADENNEGGLQFYIGKETGRIQVVMDGNTDMNEAAEIFFDNILKPMVDEYIEKRLKQ